MNKNELQLSEDIKRGGIARNKAINELYKSSLIRKTIIKNVVESGGNNADAVDVFQEAIILFDRKVRENKFDHKSKISTYIISLGKYIWFNQRRNNAKTDLTDDLTQLDQIVDTNPESQYISSEISSSLNDMMRRLGGICYKILKMWKESINLKMIAEKLNLTSYNAARKKKYRCMKKLINQIEENPRIRDLLNS